MFVCVRCGRQMRPKKNGFEFVELTRQDATDAKFSPARLWSGDLWECQDCGSEVIYTDARQRQITDSYLPNFTERSSNATVTAKPYTRESQK